MSARHGSSSLANSDHLQAAHRAVGPGKLFRFDPETLEHRDEKIRQWFGVRLVEGKSEVLAVFESTAVGEDGEVLGVAVVAVAKACPASRSYKLEFTCGK